MQMKHWITGAAVTLALAFGLSTGASALVIDDLGTIAVPGAANSGNTPASGMFSDQYEFQAANFANVLELTTTLNDSSFNIDIAGVTVSLFKALAGVGVGNAPTADGAALATAAGVAGTQVSLVFAGLAPATPYFIQVVGDASGTSGGNYSVQVNLSQVPLPPAIWLFISALVGLVSFARIRRGGAPA